MMPLPEALLPDTADLRILFIDDQTDDIVLQRHRLQRDGLEFDWRDVRTEDALRTALEEFKPGLVLCDYQIPGFSGPRALELVKEHSPATPFIFVTGTIGEETAVECLQAGATDYVLKQRPQRLTSAVRRALVESEARAEYEARIRFLAHYDPLTRLPNRTLLDDRLAQALVHAQRTNRHVALLSLDLDGFLAVGSSIGPSAADEILRGVACRISANVREGDTVARSAGDQFMVLLSDLARPEDADKAARKILAAIREPQMVAGHEVHVTATAGAALSPNDGTEPQDLIRNAGAALHRAKLVDRGGVQFCSAETMRAVRTRVELEAGLRRAMEDDELQLHFQPQHHIVDGHLCGMEALLRWPRADGQWISPATFIPVAEETGLIRPLGEWVLRKACETALPWVRATKKRLVLGVNVSAGQLHQENFADSIGRLVHETGFPAECLEIELTESGLMSEESETVKVLTRLKDLGFKIAIDDFGTGYSSLSYLSRFPIDRIKIDASFVRRMNGAARDAAIVQSIVSLGHALGFKIIAEGVETIEQLETLRAMGCDEVQGYYFSRPVPADRISVLVGR